MKGLRWLLTAALLAGMSSLTWAGAVGDFGQPHLVTITVPKTTHNTTFPNGKDSTSFYLEGVTLSLAAYYDSTSVQDTLASINLENNAAFAFPGPSWATKAATAGSGDSIFIGRLVLNLDPATSTLGSTDSFYVFTDVSIDGVNFISQAAQPSLGTHGAVLRAGALSSGTVKGGSANVVVLRNLFSSPPTTKFGGMVLNSLVCDCFGARAVRFRILYAHVNGGVANRPKKVNSATFSFYSTGPDKNK